MDAKDTTPQDVLKELQAEPECRNYAEKWMKNGVDPSELLDFLKRLRGDNKESSWKWWTHSRPVVTVGCVVTGETFGAHRTILDQVQDKHLKWIQLDGKKQQQQCQKIIVFCPITSRAGSDVEAAMTSPAVSASSKSLILVLLHHTRDEEYSTAGRRCADKFPRVECEVHFLFHETQPGLLKCSLNISAAQELREAIK